MEQHMDVIGMQKRKILVRNGEMVMKISDIQPIRLVAIVEEEATSVLTSLGGMIVTEASMIAIGMQPQQMLVRHGEMDMKTLVARPKRLVVHVVILLFRMIRSNMLFKYKC